MRSGTVETGINGTGSVPAPNLGKNTLQLIVSVAIGGTIYTAVETYKPLVMVNNVYVWVGIAAVGGIAMLLQGCLTCGPITIVNETPVQKPGAASPTDAVLPPPAEAGLPTPTEAFFTGEAASYAGATSSTPPSSPTRIAYQAPVVPRHLSGDTIVLVEVESLKESYAAHKAAIEKRKKKQEEVDAELEKLKPLVKKSKSLLEEKERLQKEIRELKEKANSVEMTLKQVTEEKRAALKEQLRALKGKKSKVELFGSPSSPRIGREDPFLSPNLTKANQKDKEDIPLDFEISSRIVSKIGRKNETSPTANG
jgi:hypothetical protein